MKKAIFTFLALTLVVGFAAKESAAAQMCWNLSPYLDSIKVNIGANVAGHQSVNGVRFWTGGNYPVVGSFEKDQNGGTSKFMSFFSANGGTSTCGYDTVLVPTGSPKYQGTWTNTCTNGAAASGTLVRINCTTLASLAPGTAGAAAGTKISSDP